MNNLKNFLSKHKIVTYLIALAISYILFSAIIFGFSDRLLFYPDDKYHPEVEERLQKILAPFKAVKNDVFIAVPNNNRIHAWYFKKPSAKMTFLISHGNAGNICYRLHLIKTLLPYGSVLIYDYEGYGKSEGSPSRKAACEDGLAAYDYLVKQQFVKPDQLILYGESLGCAVSCEISRSRKVGGIILQSGWTSLLDVARDKYLLFRLYPDYCFAQPRLNNMDVLAKAHPPLLLIHGQQDKILPCRYSQELFSSACEPKQIILLPNASHNDIGSVDSPLYTQSIGHFLRTYYPQLCP